MSEMLDGPWLGMRIALPGLAFIIILVIAYWVNAGISWSRNRSKGKDN